MRLYNMDSFGALLLRRERRSFFAPNFSLVFLKYRAEAIMKRKEELDS